MNKSEAFDEIEEILLKANEELFKDHGHAEMASILSKSIFDALGKIDDINEN